jgi:hypothetical protein
VDPNPNPKKMSSDPQHCSRNTLFKNLASLPYKFKKNLCIRKHTQDKKAPEATIPVLYRSGILGANKTLCLGNIIFPWELADVKWELETLKNQTHITV